MKKPPAECLMNTYGRLPVTMERGSGSWLWDTEDKKYLDYTTGISVNNLGHCHKKITEAVTAQAKLLVHTSNLFTIEKQSALAETLVSRSFADRAFFCNSGTEAVEGAIKLARKWGAENGGRHGIISTEGAFHGRTMGALSATGTDKYKEGFGPFLDGFSFAPYGETSTIRRLAERGDSCAVIVEPVQGENGVIIPPPGYLRRVRDICRENDMLLIFDEIQTGMGRTGKLFAYEHENVEPDIMALAKALGGGIPCGAVLAREEVAAHFTPGTHGSTFGGNPLAAAAACATVKAIFDENLLENATTLGSYFLENFRDTERRYRRRIKETRGKGLMIGIEFEDPDFAKACFMVSVNNGLLVILTVERVFRLLPPLNTSEQEMDFALATLEKSIEEATYIA